MVVDDTLSIRKLMERTLLQLGVERVVGYENGSKALDALMMEAVDIVFTDVQMPIMTGPEVRSPTTLYAHRAVFGAHVANFLVPFVTHRWRVDFAHSKSALLPAAPV
jgi:DNA-binding LytR/AlgR family response regulator